MIVLECRVVHLVVCSPLCAIGLFPIIPSQRFSQNLDPESWGVDPRSLMVVTNYEHRLLSQIKRKFGVQILALESNLMYT